MTAVLEPGLPPPHRWIAAERASDVEITQAIADPLFAPAGKSLVDRAAGEPAVRALVRRIDRLAVLSRELASGASTPPIVWGVAIANYVWWIGIGNAGTLISAMLLLTRQKWRGSINRFAEAMTLFAVAIAGIMPIVHLGPADLRLLARALSQHDGAVAAVAKRAGLGFLGDRQLSAVFDPVLVRQPDSRSCDHARPHQDARGAIVCTARSRWDGAARPRTGAACRHLHTTMAALGVPLVCSVHSIVGLDFAASLMPGWQESIFPPYFVVGAMYSGFAMVIVLALAFRWGLDLQAIITRQAISRSMGRILLMASIVMGYSYATEWFMAWYGGKHSERSLVAFEFTGTYAPLFWALLVCNVVLPQALWFPGVRRSLSGAVRDCDCDQHRDVAGADPDHLEYAVARLHAEPVAQLPFHVLGLVVPDRAARPVCVPVPDFRSPGAGRYRCSTCASSHIEEGAA